MKLVKKNEGQSLESPGHYNWVGSFKLFPEVDTKHSLFVVSHFLPGGGAQAGAAPGELIYYCLAGSIHLKSGGNECVLESGDTVYIPPGEEREFQTVGCEPAKILCVYNPTK